MNTNPKQRAYKVVISFIMYDGQSGTSQRIPMSDSEPYHFRTERAAHDFAAANSSASKKCRVTTVDDYSGPFES